MESRKFSNNQICRAGEILRKGDKDSDIYQEALDTVNEWREQFGPPLNKVLKQCEEIINGHTEQNVLFAQRLKRMPTIIDKLSRQKHMNLSRMQDIGGVRIITYDMRDLLTIDSLLTNLNEIKPIKDYIKKPNKSGYRGKHYVFSVQDTLIEIQLRTQLQHLWATSVEIIDVVYSLRLKYQIENSYWQKFFQLVSVFFDETDTKTQHNFLKESTIKKTHEELVKLIRKYRIFDKLDLVESAKVIEKNHPDRNSKYAVLANGYDDNITTITYFSAMQYEQAVRLYELQEKTPLINSVLISVEDYCEYKEAYRKAYPNYYLDLNDLKKKIIAIDEFFKKYDII